MNEELIKKASDIIRQSTAFYSPEGAEPFCVLSLIDEEGYPTSSVITAAKADGINRITFCTGLGCNKTNRINGSKKASVCFVSETYSINLVGDIEIKTDASTKREMWYEGLKNHFSGPEDPGYCVLSFYTRRYKLFVDWTELIGTIAQ